MVEQFRDGKSSRHQRGKSSDVFKRTVPDRDGKSMGGTQVLIYGKLPPGNIDVSGLQRDIAAFQPSPKGKLPKRVLFD